MSNFRRTENSYRGRDIRRKVLGSNRVKADDRKGNDTINIFVLYLGMIRLRLTRMIKRAMAAMAINVFVSHLWETNSNICQERQ